MRALIELGHVALGLIAAVGIGWLSAWSYPEGAADIWLVTAAAAVVVALLGIGPVRRGMAADAAVGEATHG